MRRSSRSNSPFSSDSLLDVLSNLVGVLIVLIVLVGLRLRQAPATIFLPVLEQKFDRERSQIEEQLRDLEQAKARQADELQRLVAELREAELSTREQEQQLARLQAELASAGRSEQEMLAELDRLADELERLGQAVQPLERKVADLEQNRPKPKRLEIRFPISRPVEGDEIHFELASRRVTLVDLESLMREAASVARGMREELRWRGRFTGQTLPVGAFALEFTLLKEQIPLSESALYGPGSFRARLVEWKLTPVQQQRGEPVEVAVKPGSEFNRVLGLHPPSRYTITLWTYADSFSAFRLIRDYLYEQGYSVAARPLPPGIPIAGSIFGTRSYKQ